MNKTALPPEREAIEREISELFSNGDFTDIARLIQKDRSAVSRAFSTTDDGRLNPFFETIIYLWAFDQLKDGLGDSIMSIIVRERAKWKPRLATKNDPVHLMTNIATQFNEFLESKLKGESYDKQIKECMDIANAAKKKKEWLIDQRNAAHFGAGRLRSFAANAIDEREERNEDHSEYIT